MFSIIRASERHSDQPTRTALDRQVQAQYLATARAEDDNVKKIVGVWELTKSAGELPVGTTIEFTKDGKLIHAKGYGWADVQTETPVKPDTLFGVASLSKTITATAILRLVEQGKLKLDDKAFEIINHIKPPAGARIDPRLHKITVRHLLEHAGGWDAQKSGDPVNWTTQVQAQRGDKTPISAEHLRPGDVSEELNSVVGRRARISRYGTSCPSFVTFSPRPDNCV